MLALHLFIHNYRHDIFSKFYSKDSQHIPVVFHLQQPALKRVPFSYEWFSRHDLASLIRSPSSERRQKRIYKNKLRKCCFNTVLIKRMMIIKTHTQRKYTKTKYTHRCMHNASHGATGPFAKFCLCTSSSRWVSPPAEDESVGGWNVSSRFPMQQPPMGPAKTSIHCTQAHLTQEELLIHTNTHRNQQQYNQYPANKRPFSCIFSE